MIEIFFKGGPVMWPLLLTSIVTLGVVIDRLWFISRNSAAVSPKWSTPSCKTWKRGITENAVEAGTGSTDFVARTLTYALTHRDTSLSQAILRVANLELKRFSRGLPVLDTVITLAPLLGLLGTVTGMIHSFGLLGNTELGAPPPSPAASPRRSSPPLSVSASPSPRCFLSTTSTPGRRKRGTKSRTPRPSLNCCS